MFNGAQVAAIGWVATLTAGSVLAAEPDARLADAVEKQNRARVQSLLKKRAPVNTAQVDGMTALHWAAYHEDEKTAKQLIAAGAEPKAKNRYGVTPISIACRNGNTAIVQMLLKSGADPNATLRGGETALMTAARTGKSGPVSALIAAGAKIDATVGNGQTALMWAAAAGNTGTVDLLLKAGADFRTPLRSGFTPFFFAVREGHIGVVRRLLEAGVKVNDVMKPQRKGGKSPATGTSALILAVENGHFDLAIVLLKAGANPNERRTGYSALHAITWVRKPLRGDGDPPPVGSGKATSLDLVNTLAKLGADVNARHKKQTRPRRPAQPQRGDTVPACLGNRRRNSDEAVAQTRRGSFHKKRRQLHPAAGGFRSRDPRQR